MSYPWVQTVANLSPLSPCPLLASDGHPILICQAKHKAMVRSEIPLNASCVLMVPQSSGELLAHCLDVNDGYSTAVRQDRPLEAWLREGQRQPTGTAQLKGTNIAFFRILMSSQ